MRTVVWSAVIAGLMSGTAVAQESAAPGAGAPAASSSNGSSGAATQASEPVAVKHVTVTTGADFTSAYLFRGIRQHSGGTIAQPSLDLGVSVGRGVSFNFGNWDSVHSTAPAGNWYESDYYGAVNFTAGRVKPGLLYTSYTSPADSFATVHELAGVFAVDDSATRFPLSPKAVLAFELGDGQADGGARKGIYLELGVKPGVKLAQKLSLYIPVKTGLSVKDYYEGPLENDHFGYFSSGFQLSMPAVSGRSGTLEVHGGMDVQVLGDNLKALNDDNRVRPIGTVGFSFVY